MGQSTDAILGFGWCGEGDVEYADDTDGDFSIREEVEKLFGVELGTHCSNDCPMPFLFDVKSKVKAWRGHPKTVGLLIADSDVSQRVCKALAWLWKEHPILAERWQLPKKIQKCEWYICSDWS